MINKGRIIQAMNNDWRRFCMEDEEINNMENKTKQVNKKPSNYEHYWKEGVDRNCRPLKEEK